MRLLTSTDAIMRLRSIEHEGNKILVHQANCHHVMGGGIAYQIAKTFPDVAQADMNTPKGPEKLGTFSSVPVFIPLAKGLRGVYNVYGQDKPGTDPKNHDGRATSYDALYNGLQRVLADWALSTGYYREPYPVEVLIPWKIGCGLAGGSWRIVGAMLQDLDDWAQKTHPGVFTLSICQRAEDAEQEESDEPTDT